MIDNLEGYLESISHNMAIIFAVQSIMTMRFDIHENPTPAMTDAQHRMIRRIFGVALGSCAGMKVITSAYGDDEVEKSLAVEILGTITGDNGRTAVRGLSKHAACIVIGELIDGETKEVTEWGRAVISGITLLIEEFPCFKERNDHIQRVATYLRDLRKADHGGPRYARVDRHTRERARELLARRVHQHRRELRPGTPGRQEPRYVPSTGTYQGRKGEVHPTHSTVYASEAGAPVAGVLKS